LFILGRQGVFRPGGVVTGPGQLRPYLQQVGPEDGLLPEMIGHQPFQFRIEAHGLPDGPEGALAFQDGEIGLPDFVHHRRPGLAILFFGGGFCQPDLFDLQGQAVQLGKGLGHHGLSLVFPLLGGGDGRIRGGNGLPGRQIAQRSPLELEI